MSILNELLEGNKRFSNNENQFPRLDKDRRLEGMKGQSPRAIIIGCADSRIPPELLFDQGLGDLFVIRVAGNIVDDAIIGSIEYAVDHLGSELVMVLSHSHCGAVDASLVNDPKDVPGSIGALVEAIKPAVTRAKEQEGDFLENATKENAKYVVEQLKKQGSIISSAYENKKIDIVATYYDIETGLVEVL